MSMSFKQYDLFPLMIFLLSLLYFLLYLKILFFSSMAKSSLYRLKKMRPEDQLKGSSTSGYLEVTGFLNFSQYGLVGDIITFMAVIVIPIFISVVIGLIMHSYINRINFFKILNLVNTTLSNQWKALYCHSLRFIYTFKKSIIAFWIYKNSMYQLLLI